jgi:hypothetical protein
MDEARSSPHHWARGLQAPGRVSTQIKRLNNEDRSGRRMHVARQRKLARPGETGPRFPGVSHFQTARSSGAVRWPPRTNGEAANRRSASASSSVVSQTARPLQRRHVRGHRSRDRAEMRPKRLVRSSAASSRHTNRGRSPMWLESAACSGARARRGIVMPFVTTSAGSKWLGDTELAARRYRVCRTPA